ncbi:MAG: helix-hairpin-helix domain-containing protein [Candidatus Makaraimicrobium thalassicum]|nr:MAG: helix-hairpin-helix domain-containing protein [Candidatus Omnitrophota bacterium]
MDKDNGKSALSLTRPEKLVLIILSLLLFIGAAALHWRRSRPFEKIVVAENGVRKELTLKQVEGLLREKRKININTASFNELTLIPGIGRVLASRIIEYRNSCGTFYHESDLLDVEGIGEKKLEKMKDFLRMP